MSIFIDGEFALGVSSEVCHESHLRIGDAIDQVALVRLEHAEAFRRARERAFGLLARRPRSTQELRHRLRERETESAVVEGVVTYLTERDYLDDRAFADFWISNRQENRPRGRILISQELRQKGVDRAIIEEALQAVDLGEIEAAEELARRRLPSLVDLPPDVKRRRLTGFLTRKGFGWDIVKAVTDQVLSMDEGDRESL